MPFPESHISPDGVLTFVVKSVGNDDVAIGFLGYPSHTHANILSSIAGVSEDEAVREYVDALLADKSIIAIQTIDNAVSDIWITDDPKSELRHQGANEQLEFRYWSGRKYER